MDLGLRNRRAVVVGGSKGLGSAIAACSQMNVLVFS